MYSQFSISIYEVNTILDTCLHIETTMHRSWYTKHCGNSANLKLVTEVQKSRGIKRITIPAIFVYLHGFLNPGFLNREC